MREIRLAVNVCRNVGLAEWSVKQEARSEG